MSSFDIEKIRADFPVLRQKVHGHPLVYFDNAATAQKPRIVLDAIQSFYVDYCANIHRGVHYLSEQATSLYESARGRIARFINASAPEEIIFVRGTTEGINLVASTFGRTRVGEGDEVVITEMEHHSNIVPWQMLCEEKGAKLRVVPMDDRGELRMEEYARLLNGRTKLVAVSHVSNALGTVNDLPQMIRHAHDRGIPVVVDGAQSVPHLKVDVRKLDADFYAFSGHKLYGPTGVGVLYGKRALLEAMPPYQGGGHMIHTVTFEKTTYGELPHKFEAGTAHIAGGIGLGAAVDYLEAQGLERLLAYEDELLAYAEKALAQVPGVRPVGTARHKASVVSFLVGDVHPHDVGTILDQEGIAIRVGHHCAQPVMEHYRVPATCRASLAFYNTREEVDALCRGLRKVKEVFG